MSLMHEHKAYLLLMGNQVRLSHGNANLCTHRPDLSFVTLRLFPEVFCWDLSFTDADVLFSLERVQVASLKLYVTTQLGIIEQYPMTHMFSCCHELHVEL